MVCTCLLGLLFLKGIPVIPVMVIFILFAIAAFYATRAKQQTTDTQDINHASLYEKIRIYPVEIALNPVLFDELAQQEQAFLHHIQQLRERLAFDLGFVMPEVKLRADKKMNYPFYAVYVQGNQQGINQLYMDKLLAIALKPAAESLSDGINVRAPGYGLPATWVPVDQTLSSDYSVQQPLAVLTAHISDIVQNNLPDLLTRAQTETLLAQPAVCTLRDELIPAMLPFGHVQRILQNLLQEKVSIRFMTTILDVLLEHGKTITDTPRLTELVRARLATPICQKLLSNQNNLPVMTLAPPLEQKLCASISNQQLALEPALTEGLITSLAHQVERMLTERKRPVLLCSSLLRRHIKQLTQRVIPHLTVLGMNEIPVNIQIESFGIVTGEQPC